MDFRLPLPPRIARDRNQGDGGYDYFIRMHDASHPNRQFIKAGRQTLTGADPLPDDLRDAMAKIDSHQRH